MDIRTLAAIFSLIYYCSGVPVDYCRICDAERCVEEEMECCKTCSAKIHCSSKEMTVAIPRIISRIPLEDLSFADSSCVGAKNDTHYIFKTATTECGTKMIPIRRSHFVYKNEIRHKNGAPLYSLTCLFERKTKPARRHLVVKTGKHNKSKLYHTSLEGRRLNKKKVYLDDRDYLFFEVKSPTTLRARGLVMGVKKCQLDITEDSNEPGNNPKIDMLLDNGYVRSLICS